MRIAAFCPFDLDAVSGNVVTLRRIRAALDARGHGFSILSVGVDTTPEEAFGRAMESRPDVVHFYHAYKTGRLIPAFDGVPCVVTLSGTDVSLDWEDPAHRPAMERALDGAGRIVTYNGWIRDRLRRIAPRFAPKAAVIPKGISAGEEPYDLRAVAGIGPDETLFLMPGGIRPVKNNLFAAEGLARAVREGLSVRLVYAGPILDRFYGKMFLQRLQESSWIGHVERIPHEAMMSAHRTADVVVNTSQSEGLSNALMEAMAAGRAVLAADIPGNRDLIRDGETGVLYHRANFEEKAERMIRDRGWREALGRAAHKHAAATFSAEREAEALLGAYEAALTSSPDPRGSSPRPGRPTS